MAAAQGRSHLPHLSQAKQAASPAASPLSPPSVPVSPLGAPALGQAQTPLTGIFASHSDSSDTHTLDQGTSKIQSTGSELPQRTILQPKLSGPAPALAKSSSDQPMGVIDWDAAYEEEDQRKRHAKVDEDLKGWRGGHGEPRSAYSSTAIPANSYFAQPPTGDMAQHLPKEVVRIERDWSDGEVCQFETAFPMELDGRISPADFSAFIASLNARMTSAYSVKAAVIDNLFAIATWWTSLLWHTSHFEKELRNVERLIAEANDRLFCPKGLKARSPRDVALQFLEIEYY